MDDLFLAEAIDPPGSLLESRRAPRALKMNHDSALMLKIESFSRRVSRKKQRSAVIELPLRGRSLIGRHSAMQHDDAAMQKTKLVVQTEQRVAILREHDCRLLDCRDKFLQPLDFGFTTRGARRSFEYDFQPAPLTRDV